MAKVAKVAVSVDADVLAATEKLRKTTGESRSAVVTRALRALVADRERRGQIEEYLEAYTRTPETTEEIEAAEALARASLQEVPW
ncbi:MAG: ribbon-helix-helix protein, CopG family [Myxococcota bacterium]